MNSPVSAKVKYASICGIRFARSSILSIRTSLPDTHTVNVTSLGGLGDGLSRLNGKPLFIEKAAAGDRLNVRIIHDTKEALRGEIIEVIEAGPDRITPPCPYFTHCGGCSLQHISETAYRSAKLKVLADALAHAGFGEIKADVTFLPAASRRRVEFKVSRTEEGMSFAYYAPRSNHVVPVASCLILEPALQSLMQPLAKALGQWPGANSIKTVSLTQAESGIDMLLELTAPLDSSHSLETIADHFSIARIAVIYGAKTAIVVNHKPVIMRLSEFDIALPPGAFLQASREGQRLLTDAVLAGVKGAKLVADLFCGIGTYSFPLSKAARVHAVESDVDMVRNVKAMTQLHGNHRSLTAEQRDLFKNPLTAGELSKFDAIIVNPPRPGAKAQCEQIAKSNIKKLAMVSCSPASFARDAKILKNAGFALESAQGIDQFVYSPHLEIVAIFKK